MSTIGSNTPRIDPSELQALAGAGTKAPAADDEPVCEMAEVVERHDYTSGVGSLTGQVSAAGLRGTLARSRSGGSRPGRRSGSTPRPDRGRRRRRSD